MPGTAHGVTDHEALDKRPVIMGAVGTDRKHLYPAARQQNLLPGNMTSKHVTVLKLIERDAER
jgi:hypothetical protein